MINGIIFDCYGVLAHGSLQYLQSLAPNANALQAFNDLTHAADRGYVTQDEYMAQASQLLGRPPAEIKDIRRSQEVKNLEMVRYVMSLRSRFKTALLSNIGRGSIRRIFTDKELDELFDVVVLSSDVGMMKPDVEIYEYAASQLGLSTNECVMIDDTPVNVQGAKDVGMEGIHFTSVLQVKDDLGRLLEGVPHA